MALDQTPKAIPQFETAEYQNQTGTNECVVCHKPISSSYFRVNGRMVCSPCSERLKTSAPKDSHAAFSRAVAFGAGAAVAGLALYAAVTITTGLMIGYVSLAVGWMVGKAMMKGSGGIGGRRYQVTALLLTYAAVSVAAVPIAIAEFAKQKRAHSESKIQSPAPSASQADTSSDENSAAAPNNANPARDSRPSALSAIGSLLVLGLASPFLELGSDPLHGLIGLVILLVGVRIAWRITCGRPPLVFDGPF
jgi:hypothetical protein